MQENRCGVAVDVTMGAFTVHLLEELWTEHNEQ
jgi:hypothetical protein